MISSTQAAILGTLRDSPRTGLRGADLGKVLSGQLSPDGIYVMLERLEKLGVVSSRIAAVDGYRARFFRLTPLGRDVHHAWELLHSLRSRPRTSSARAGSTSSSRKAPRKRRAAGGAAAVAMA